MSRWKINAGIVLQAALFGFGFVIMKYAVAYVEPVVVALVRTIIASLFFLPLAIRRRPRLKVGTSDRIRLVIAGLAGVAANQLLFVLGLERTTASHSSVINATIPVLTLVYAALFRYEKASARKVAGLFIALGGIYYLMEVDQLAWSSRTVVGDLLTFGNANAYALYLVIARPLSSRYSSFWITGMLFLVGFGGIAPIGAGPLLAQPWSSYPLSVWAALAYAGVGISIVTYWLATWLLRHTESSHVAQGVYLQPMIAIVVASAFLGEQVSPRLALATVVVLVGVAVAQTAIRSRPSGSKASSRRRIG